MSSNESWPKLVCNDAGRRTMVPYGPLLWLQMCWCLAYQGNHGIIVCNSQATRPSSAFWFTGKRAVQSVTGQTTNNIIIVDISIVLLLPEQTPKGITSNRHASNRMSSEFGSDKLRKSRRRNGMTKGGKHGHFKGICIVLSYGVVSCTIKTWYREFARSPLSTD